MERLSQREKDIVNKEESLKAKEKRVDDLKNSIKDRISVESYLKVMDKLSDLEVVYSEKERQLQQCYEEMKTKYKSAFYGTLIYGIVATLFTAIQSEVFLNYVVEFVQVLWNGLLGLFLAVWSIGTFVAQVGDIIPEQNLALIIHWILQTIVSLGILAGIGFLGLKGYYLLVAIIKEKMIDEITLVFLLGGLAIIVFFSEVISNILPINLILLYVLSMVVYMGTRGVAEMEDTEMRKIMFVDVGCASIGIIAVWYALKIIGDALGSLAR